MREYFVLAASLSVLVALGGLMIYGEEGGKSARAAMGVILLCTLSIPPAKAVLALRDADIGGLFEEVGEVGGGSVLGEVASESFAEGTEKMICERFSISEDEVEVHVFGLDTSSMRAEKIVVVLRGRGALSDLRGIRAAVEDAGLGKCEVNIEAS